MDEDLVLCGELVHMHVVIDVRNKRKVDAPADEEGNQSE